MKDKTTITRKVDQLFKASTPHLYAAGSIIIFANQEPTGVFLLEQGVIEQYDITPEGNKITINTFREGAFLPMSWAINNTANEYFYAAASDVILRQVPAETATAFLQENPDVLYDLLSRVYRGTDALLRRLVVMASGEASSRLMYELLIEAYRFGHSLDKSRCEITMKRTSLAERSGLARETVSRELHKLEREGLVACAHQRIIVYTDKIAAKLEG